MNTDDGQCRFNVVNIAARAYSTNQQLALYEKLGQMLDADHIVLFFYINDFIDVDIESRYERYKHLDWYMFDLDAKPDAEIQAKWQWHQLLRNSAIAMWVYDHIKELSARGNFFQQLLEGTKTDEVTERLANMLNHLERFSALANENGVKFTLAIVPAPVQVSHEFKNELYQSQLLAFAAENDIPSIDLRMGLMSYYKIQGRIPVIPYDGHFDSTGNEVMAEQVHKQLLAEGLSCGMGL